MTDAKLIRIAGRLYLPWSCDVCTAGCTFEAMELCAKRYDPVARCSHEEQTPLARHRDTTGKPPDHEGMFEFVSGPFEEP